MRLRELHVLMLQLYGTNVSGIDLLLFDAPTPPDTITRLVLPSQILLASSITWILWVCKSKTGHDIVSHILAFNDVQVQGSLSYFHIVLILCRWLKRREQLKNEKNSPTTNKNENELRGSISYIGFNNVQDSLSYFHIVPIQADG